MRNVHLRQDLHAMSEGLGNRAGPATERYGHGSVVSTKSNCEGTGRYGSTIGRRLRSPCDVLLRRITSPELFLRLYTEFPFAFARQMW